MSKEAMKDMIKWDRPCYKCFSHYCDLSCKEALAKQEQGEPVTWRNAAIRVGEDLCSVGPFGYYDMTAKQWLDWALSVVTVHLPPQQRTWVGLTDEESEEIQKVSTCYEQAIELTEAKLKDKNL